MGMYEITVFLKKNEDEINEDDEWEIEDEEYENEEDVLVTVEEFVNEYADRPHRIVLEKVF